MERSRTWGPGAPRVGVSSHRTHRTPGCPDPSTVLGRRRSGGRRRGGEGGRRTGRGWSDSETHGLRAPEALLCTPAGEAHADAEDEVNERVNSPFRPRTTAPGPALPTRDVGLRAAPWKGGCSTGQGDERRGRLQGVQPLVWDVGGRSGFLRV